MSAQAGWYPDPGGGQNLYRYWDGRAWSAATTYNPQAAPPVAGFGGSPGPVGRQAQSSEPSSTGRPRARTRTYQATQQRKSPVGWWIAAAALVVVIVVVAVIAVRAIGGAHRA